MWKAKWASAQLFGLNSLKQFSMNTKGKACIIDDDAIHEFGMTALMKRLGFSNGILVYHDGQEAIEGITKMYKKGIALPKVIFLDLNMPIKDGWGFLDDLLEIPQQDRENVVIYILSSSNHPSDMERAKKYSIVRDYLIKPLAKDDLFQILKEHF